ncbi:hypothetical protein D3C78_596540 [compost metagenome]
MTEGAARRRQGVVRLARLQGDPVDLLHAVGNTDGEDQERHQHRIRVEPEAEEVHQAQLPDHCHQRRAQHGDGTAQAVGEPQQEDQGDDEGDAEEHHDHHQAIDQVTDLLGETDDVDLHIRVLRFELGADLVFKLVGELAIVQRQQLALVLRVRVGLQQRNVDDARLEIVGHQAPDLTGLEHVVAQQIETGLGAVVALRNHFTAGEALFRHFGPANAGAPQRLEAGTVDAGDVEHLVVDLTQGLHVLLGEDVAIGGFHRDPHGVAQVRQIVAVLHHLLDEGMLQRDHFFEAGGRTDQRRLPEQENTDQQADRDHCRAVVEDQALEERRLVLVMSTQGSHSSAFLLLTRLICPTRCRLAK